MLVIPPAVFLVILVPVSVRRKRLLDVDFMQSKKAFQEFSRQAKNIKKSIGPDTKEAQTAGSLNDSVRLYLGKRLGLPPGAIIYDEIQEHLYRKGVDKDLLTELKNILDWCEAYHYAGSVVNESGGDGPAAIIDNAHAVIRKIDKCLTNRQTR